MAFFIFALLVTVAALTSFGALVATVGAKAVDVVSRRLAAKKDLDARSRRVLARLRPRVDAPPMMFEVAGPEPEESSRCSCGLCKTGIARTAQ